MKRKLIFACMISMLLLSHAYAEDNAPFSGGIFLGGRAITGQNWGESANFNKYNSIAPGLFGGGNILYDKDKYWFSADGAYLGDQDWYLKLKGGRWGDFKYSLYFTEFPNNISFENRNIITTPGSPVQAPALPISRDSTRWPSQDFDYKYTRKDIGGTFDLTMIRPFFFSVDANQLKREGQVPWGAIQAGGSPGSPFTEIALPVNDTTKNINSTFGWKSKQYFAAFSTGYSKYTNDAEYTSYKDPTGTVNNISGPPENYSYYFKLTGTAKLPLASTFALTGSYQDNKSNTSLTNTFINLPTVTTSSNRFNGDIEYWNVAANLTSNPWKNLTTKLYFKYLDSKNKSDVVNFFNKSTGAFLDSNETFDYQTTTFGAEAAYRFTKNLKGILGYEFSDLQRRKNESELAPFTPEQNIPDTWTNKFNAQLVWNPLDWLGTRLKYQKMYRGASIDLAAPVNVNAVDAANQNAILNNYKQDFYAARKTQDMIKATFDLTPIPNLDLTLEYAFKHDSYDGQTLGFYKAQQNEFIMDGSYDWKGIKFFGFFDWDQTWLDQQTRQSTTTAPASALPQAGVVLNAAGNGANSFNWRSSQQNNNYAYGTGTSFPIIKNKLSFTVQYDFQKNNGTGDFTSQFISTNPSDPRVLNPALLNLNPWDDYTMQSISARLTYNFNKQFSLVGGWVYRQFKYNDAQIPALDPNQGVTPLTSINGYRYVMPSTGTVTGYLSGAYTDQSYNANIFFLRAMYRF